MSCKDKQRYADNRESRLAAVHKYREDNALEISKRAKARYRADPEKRSQFNRESYLRHREKRIAEAVRYQTDNPQVVALTRARRKAVEAFRITQRDHRRLLERYRHSCAYCEVRLTKWGRDLPTSLQWDHVLPMAKGGRDSVGNLLPACRQCNGAKSAKLLILWKRQL